MTPLRVSNLGHSRRMFKTSMMGEGAPTHCRICIAVAWLSRSLSQLGRKDSTRIFDWSPILYILTHIYIYIWDSQGGRQLLVHSCSPSTLQSKSLVKKLPSHLRPHLDTPFLAKQCLRTMPSYFKPQHKCSKFLIIHPFLFMFVFFILNFEPQWIIRTPF